MRNLPPAASLDIPLLRDFANPPGTVLKQRLERRYRRLCFVQGELMRLNSLKAAEKAAGLDSGAVKNPAPASSFEDFVFANMNFNRYKKIPDADFNFYIDGIDDFDNLFFLKNFKIDAAEAEAAIISAYKKSDSFYCLGRMNPLILSLMRTLETSLETAALAREEEIISELNALYSFLSFEKKQPPPAANAAEGKAAASAGIFSHENVSQFYTFLIGGLDGLVFVHSDGSKTRLFLNPEKRLVGTFLPGNKPWTMPLV